MKHILLAIALLWISDASAYCIYNQLPDRSVRVEQDVHPDKLRDERRLKAIIPPGRSACCPFHNLDCNPLGRDNSLVNLSVTIPGDPEFVCAFAPSTEPLLKLTGGATVRVEPNARRSAYPYIVRIRTHDGKSSTPPKGLACVPTKPKGN